MSRIEEINERIRAKGNQIAMNAKDSILKIIVPNPPSVNLSLPKDDPARPWMLAGAVCLAAGLIASISGGTKWTVFLGVLGVASLGMGLSKKKEHNSQAGNQVNSSPEIDDTKAYVVEKCNAILDSYKREWDGFMGPIKDEVQGVIRNTAITEEKKEEYLSFTYYPESLSLSTLSLIDKMDGIDNSKFYFELPLKQTEFANEIATSILKSVNEQINAYSQIHL